MERVCPECNRLDYKKIKCSCGKCMHDLGRAQELFQDDYTANMPINDAVDYCVHIFKCDSCGNSEFVPVNKIKI